MKQAKTVLWVSVLLLCLGTGASAQEKRWRVLVRGAGGTYVAGKVSGCELTLSAGNSGVASTGGTSSFEVRIAGGCPWTATSTAAWLSVTSGGNGTGIGTVSLTAVANTEYADRTGVVEVKDGNEIVRATHLVTQEARAVTCTYQLSSAGASFLNNGGNGSFNVSVLALCAWTIISDSDWLTVTGGSFGEGDRTVTYDVGYNAGADRIGYLQLKNSAGEPTGQVFRVDQAGAATCAYSIPGGNSASFPSVASTGSFQVVATNGCAWSAEVVPAGWLSVTAGTPGNGNGQVALAATKNTAYTARTAVVQIKDPQNSVKASYTVTQAAKAAGCAYALSDDEDYLPDAGATRSFNVSTASTCAWTAESSQPEWLTVTSGAGTGSGTVTYQAAANGSGVKRTALLQLLDGSRTVQATYVVVQGCGYLLRFETMSYNYHDHQGTEPIEATSGCAWTAASDSAWLQITGTTATSLSYAVLTNSGNQARSGVIRFHDSRYPQNNPVALLTIFQDGQITNCTYAITPASATMPKAGGEGAISVTPSSPACDAPTVQSNASWLTAGYRNGAIIYVAEANPNHQNRSATITLTNPYNQNFSLTFTLTQSGR